MVNGKIERDGYTNSKSKRKQDIHPHHIHKIKKSKREKQFDKGMVKIPRYHQFNKTALGSCLVSFICKEK